MIQPGNLAGDESSGGKGKELGDALEEVPLDLDIRPQSLHQYAAGNTLQPPKGSGDEDKEPGKEHQVVQSAYLQGYGLEVGK